MVKTIKNHMVIMTTSPPPIEWEPKKTMDQRRFRNNCRKKSWTALIELPLMACLTTRKRDIPIRTYSVDQTGPNSQSGGVKLGFSKSIYQLAIDGNVKSAPTVPTSWGRRIENIRSGNSVLVSFILIH